VNKNSDAQCQQDEGAFAAWIAAIHRCEPAGLPARAGGGRPAVAPDPRRTRRVPAARRSGAGTRTASRRSRGRGRDERAEPAVATIAARASPVPEPGVRRSAGAAPPTASGPASSLDEESPPLRRRPGLRCHGVGRAQQEAAEAGGQQFEEVRRQLDAAAGSISTPCPRTLAQVRSE